jgi:hypothetical protein
MVRDGGEFPAALSELESELGEGRRPVVGGLGGPGIVTGLDRENGRILLVRAGGGEAPMPLVDFRDEWERGGWTEGPVPFLRVSVAKGGSPRALDDVARAGFETMLALLDRATPIPGAEGLDAWNAWADAVRDDRLSDDEQRLLHGDFLIRHGVGRLVAGQFMLEVLRALPEEHRPPVEAASRCYREIHNPAPTGEIWGTGLFPEVAQCVQTDEHADPAKFRDAALRSRAADLLVEIGAQEREAVEQIRSLPPEWRSVS